MNITLIVTGKLEQIALGTALGRVFPDARFSSQKVYDPGGGFRGFTSSTVDRKTAGHPRSNVRQFAASLVTALEPGRRGFAAPDVVVGVEDLELANAHQPEVVVDTVRDAVRAHVEENFQGKKRDRVYEALREKASFHLLAPMVEAYFFGEEAALDRAGRVAGRVSQFDAGKCDPERFVVADVAYAAVPEPTGQRARADWRTSRGARERHPKKYVSYLADQHLDGDSRYRESTTGKAALESIAWDELLTVKNGVPFMRALLADLSRSTRVADGLEVGDTKCETWRSSIDQLLRNI